MLFLLIAALSGIIVLVSWTIYRQCDPKRYSGKKELANIVLMFSSIISVSAFFASFFVSALAWSEQISDEENVIKYRQIEQIYQSKAEALTAEFAQYLASEYPEYEKNIFDKISPGTVGMYFVKYPELRSSETIVVLVEHINELQSDVYAQQVSVAKVEKDIRYRQRNPWLLQSMIPDVTTPVAMSEE